MEWRNHSEEHCGHTDHDAVFSRVAVEVTEAHGQRGKSTGVSDWLVGYRQRPFEIDDKLAASQKRENGERINL